MKKTRLVAIAAAAALLVTTGTSTSYAAKKRYVISVKLIGVGWFDNMDKGIKKNMKITTSLN